MSWVNSIHSALQQRDQHEQSHLPLVHAYQRLAKQASILKDRNHALLAAANSPSAAGVPGGASGDNVRAALLNSLEQQLTATKLELSEQYKVQASNAQRLLVLTDNLREAEDRGREERDELRKLRSEVDGLRERARWHKEVVVEKEKQLLILQDDHASMELELSQLTIQNENLKIDNASLLSRWIASKNEEASKMNDIFQAEQKQQRGVAKPKSSSSDAGSDRSVPGKKATSNLSPKT